MPVSFFVYEIYCQGLILACAIVGCCLMRRNWPFRYKLLVIMSCATFAVEMSVLYLRLHPYFKRNSIYSVWLPLEAFTIVFILYRGATHTWVRSVCRILLMIFSAVVVISYILNPVSSCCIFTFIISMKQLLIKAGFSDSIYMPFSYAANTFMYGGFIACFVTLRREVKRKMIDLC